MTNHIWRSVRLKSVLICQRRTLYYKAGTSTNRLSNMTTTTYKTIGRLDATTSGAIEKELFALLVGEVDSINIDMSELNYVSSAGLRVLLVIAKAAKAKGGKLVLFSLKPAILEVIKISGFDRIIAIQT